MFKALEIFSIFFNIFTKFFTYIHFYHLVTYCIQFYKDFPQTISYISQHKNLKHFKKRIGKTRNY